MVVAVERLEIVINGNRSLKGKRQVVLSLIRRIRSRFGNVSIAEVGSQDMWQRATLGITLVSSESRVVNSVADQILYFISNAPSVEIVEREREIIHF